MTNAEIEVRMQSLVQDERRITGEIVKLINLADERRLYLERGFSSLFDWLTRGYGYSSSAAYRRIEAARLIRAVPAAAEKLENGSVNLTTLAQARQAIRSQEKASGKVSLETMAQAVEAIENKSSAEAETALFELLPQAASAIPQEREVTVANNETRLTFNLSAEAMADLEWIKDYLSHPIPSRENSAVFTRLLKEFRERHEKRGERRPRKSSKQQPPVDASGSKSESGSATAAAEVKVTAAPAVDRATSAAAVDQGTAAAAVNPVRKVTIQAVPAVLRRAVFTRAGRRCEFVDPRTGRRCTSTYQLQVDHILPRAVGGTNDAENLRCLCRAHNLHAAHVILGPDRANSWRAQA